MSRFRIGDKVTVGATLNDPPHIACHPCARVVEIKDDDENGLLYWVGHPAEGQFRATRFGPYRSAQLITGW